MYAHTCGQAYQNGTAPCTWDRASSWASSVLRVSLSIYIHTCIYIHTFVYVYEYRYLYVCMRVEILGAAHVWSSCVHRYRCHQAHKTYLYSQRERE